MSGFITRITSKINDIRRNLVFDISNIRQVQKQYYFENKASYILTLFTGVILFAFFFILFISMCFFNNSTPIFGALADTRIQLLIALLVLVLIFFMFKGLQKVWNLPVLRNCSFTCQLVILFFILLSVQIILVINIHTVIGWDVGMVVNDAIHAIHNAPIDSEYMSIYPNNLLLFFILYYITRFLNSVGSSNYWLWLAMVNVVFVDIAIIATIITVRKIYPSFKRIYLLFIFLSLLIGLSPWIIVPYSDTFLMPVVSLIVFLCLLTVQAESLARQATFTFGIGALFAIGWLIKPTVITIAAALFVVGVIYLFQKRGKIIFKHSIVVLLTGCLTLVLTLGLFNLYTEKQNIIIIDETIRTPASYTVATGLVIQPAEPAEINRFYYGVWNTEVAELNYGTTEEKNERLFAFIKEKLSEYGAFDYAVFLLNKARWITSDGSFHWLGEGGGTAYFTNEERNVFKALLYPTSNYFPIYMNAANGLWIVVLFGISLCMLMQCFTGFGKERLRNNFDLFLRLIAFFSIFVILITEGRSRYLLSFMPMFCIVAVSGYSYIVKLLERNENIKS